MTDREMLELAAKAAGNCGRYLWTPDFAGIEQKDGSYWNPLDYDGDALRLAVKLSLDVMTCCQQHNEIQVGGAVARTIFQPSHIDPYAATRRAIVRAAAEIGKASHD